MTIRTRALASLSLAAAVLVLLAAPAAHAKAKRACKGIKGTPSKNCVTWNDMANESVGGQHVVDGSLTGADIADGSITAADLQPGLIQNGPQANSINGGHVQDGSLTGQDVRDGTLNAADQLDAPGANWTGLEEWPQNRLFGNDPNGMVVKTITLQAPAPGVAIVTADGRLANNSSVANRMSCGIAPRAELVDALLWSLDAQTTQGASLSRGFNVTAGTQQFHLFCKGAAGANISYVSMTAVYYPTRR